MKRHLSTAKLLTFIRRTRKKERANMELWLDSYVEQPHCGCKLKWEWLWAPGDWIMPINVGVLPVAVKTCKRHQKDHYDTVLFEEDLLEVLKKCREINDLQPGIGDV